MEGETWPPSPSNADKKRYQGLIDRQRMLEALLEKLDETKRQTLVELSEVQAEISTFNDKRGGTKTLNPKKK